VDEADVILMVTDGQVGLQPGDQEIIEWIRTKHPGKPITMAVNKCESVQKGAIQVRSIHHHYL
jgi:GTP-binding protein